MQAILISKNEINKINLPKSPIGSYWITSKGTESVLKVTSETFQVVLYDGQA